RIPRIHREQLGRLPLDQRHDPRSAGGQRDYPGRCRSSEAGCGAEAPSGGRCCRSTVVTADFVGANLRLIRQFQGLSLTELGELVNVSKQYLSRVEAGGPLTAQLENALVEKLLVLPEFFRIV